MSRIAPPILRAVFAIMEHPDIDIDAPLTMYTAPPSL
jgi:hypothetical protein